MMYKEHKWGQEKTWADNEEYIGKLIFMHSGGISEEMEHNTKDKTYFVLRGSLTIEIFTIDNVASEKIVHENSAFRVRAKTRHKISAHAGTVKMIEVSTPEFS